MLLGLLQEGQSLNPEPTPIDVPAIVNKMGKYEDDTTYELQLSKLYRMKAQEYKNSFNGMADKDSTEGMRLQMLVHEMEQSRGKACESLVELREEAARRHEVAENSPPSRRLLATHNLDNGQLVAGIDEDASDLGEAASVSSAMRSKAATKQGAVYVSVEENLCKSFLAELKTREETIEQKLLASEQRGKALKRTV